MKEIIELRINFKLTDDEILSELNCTQELIDLYTLDLPDVHLNFDQKEFRRKFNERRFKNTHLLNHYEISLDELSDLSQKMRKPTICFIRLLDDLKVSYQRELVYEKELVHKGNGREAKICLEQLKLAHKNLMAIIEEKHPVLKCRIEQQLEIIEKNAIKYGIESEKLGKSENVLTSLNK